MAIKGPAACQDQADNGEHTPPDESPKRSAREANKNDSFETNDKASATRKKKIEKKKIKGDIKLAGNASTEQSSPTGCNLSTKAGRRICGCS